RPPSRTGFSKTSRAQRGSPTCSKSFSVRVAIPRFARNVNKKADSDSSGEIQLPQPLLQVPAQVFALQRKIHCSLQEAQLVAGIMALALKAEAIELFFLEK